MYANLQQVCDALLDWCTAHQLAYDIVRDESDLQGILILKRGRGRLQQLLQWLQPVVDQHSLQLRQQSVRAGTILILSLRSLAEADLIRMVESITMGDTPVRAYAARIAAIFDGPAPAPAIPPKPDLKTALMVSASQLAEAQRPAPTRRRRGHTSDSSAQATTTPSQASTGATTGSRKGLSEQRFAGVLGQVLAELAPPVPTTPGGAEGLQGLGAEQQPVDLFQRFAQALQTLGTQMKIGPIQQLLQKQGIRWQKSEDGQALIFYVQNAQTKAPQPIARVGAQTLSKPQEFQKQLASMLDFAKGQAPGTEQQKYDEAQEAQKQLRDIAQQLAPQEQQQQAAPAAAAPAPAPAPAGALGK